MTYLTSDNYESTVASGKVFVTFGATWCGYCRMMEPVIEDLAAKYAGEVTVAKVDADAEPTLIKQNKVRAFPTFVMFKDGVETGRKTGAQSMEDLESMIG